MQPLRYLMQKEGLYNAGTQDFTKEDLEKAKQNKTIKNNVHFQNLMENVNSDEGFIELMNNVASTNNLNSQRLNIPMAKRGGGLLNKTMECNSCGWEWKAADGGNDVSTCHKCGGSALPKAQAGTEVDYITERMDDFDGNFISPLLIPENINPFIKAQNRQSKEQGTYSALRHLYAGNKIKDSIISKSNYRPTKGDTPESNYYSITNDLVKEQMGDIIKYLEKNKGRYLQAFKEDMYNKYPDDPEYAEKIYNSHKHNSKNTGPVDQLNDTKWNIPRMLNPGNREKVPLGVLGDYQISSGEDERGKYYTYYDVWDTATPAEFLGAGKKFSVYDRIYLDELDQKQTGGSALPKAQFGLPDWLSSGADYVMDTVNNVADSVEDGYNVVVDNAEDILTDVKTSLNPYNFSQTKKGDNPLNAFLSGDFKKIPTYEGANKDEAFKKARKKLGPGQEFLYDGVRYGTDFKGETTHKGTNNFFNRMNKGIEKGEITNEQFERFKEVWIELGQPKLEVGEDKYDNILTGKSWAELGLDKSDHVNPFTGSVFIAKPSYYAENYMEQVLNEFTHVKQQNDVGRVDYTLQYLKDLAGSGIEEVNNFINETKLNLDNEKGIKFGSFNLDNIQENLYDTPGTLENHAHRSDNNLKDSYINYVIDGQKLRYGGSLPKAQPGREIFKQGAKQIAKHSDEIISALRGFIKSADNKKELLPESFLKLLSETKPKIITQYNPNEIYRGVYLNDEIRNSAKFAGKSDDEILEIMGTQIPGNTGTIRKRQFNQTLNFGRDFDQAAEHIRKFTNPNSIYTIGNTDDLLNGQKYVLKVKPNSDLNFISAEQQNNLYRETIEKFRIGNPNGGFSVPTHAKDFNYQSYYDAGYAKPLGLDMPIRSEGTNVLDGNFPQFFGNEGDVIGRLLKSMPIKKTGGSLPQAQNGNFGGVNTDILDTSGEPVYETINPGDSNYDAKYRETYNAGAFAFAPNPLDEMVMYAGVDYEKYPYYNDLSKQDREYFKDDGPIGRGVRRRAQTKRGLAEDALDIPGQLLRGALETAQAPQAAMVEGIEALRGNNYNFSNALPGSGGQKLPSQAFGFEDKPGWDIGGSLNTAMDIVADPTNLVGVGLYDDIVKLGLKATPKLNSITKTFGKSLNKTDDFTSSINWGSWNKEIPTNKVLMKEYNAIEQAAKKNGTWMKYSDGSAFNGSPEQFVQMNSKNLYNFAGGKEAAEQMYKNPKFRGGHQHIDDFIHRDRNDWATFLTDNKKNAESYATSDGTTKEFFNPAVNKPGEWVDGIYQLGFPTNLPTVTSNANGRSWRLLDYDDGIAQGLTNNRVDIHQKNLLNWSDGFLDDYNLQGYNPSNKYLSTDDYAAYVKNKANNEVVAKIKNVKDQMGTSTDIPTNTVYAVDAERVPLKSLLYNNGDFAMTNSNIYKAIVPGAIGAGAVSQMGPKQEDEQFQNGGSLPEAQGGWVGLFKAGAKQAAKYSDEIASLLKNLYKLNPNRFKTNPDNFYHRSQNYKDNILKDQLVPWLQGNPELAAELTKKIPGKFNLFKTKSNYDELYWSKGTPLDGRYYTKQSYPGPYVWEMPSSMKSINKVNGKVKSFNDNLGSYKVNTEPLKVSDAKLYAEHWWKGYKQIDPLKKQEGGSLPQAQNAGEDVQNAQQNVQNRAVIFTESPEYSTYPYDINSPIYDSNDNLIENYPSDLESSYNNYNLTNTEIKNINDKRIAEQKQSSYLQFLISEKDKMKKQHDAMYKEFEENGYYEGLENESKFVEFQEKYQNLGNQIGQFTEQIDNRESKINKQYDLQLDSLYSKNTKAFNNFYDSKYNIPTKTMDSTFYKEAQNLQKVYERLQPNTNVEIVPVYNNPDTMRQKVADLNKNDAMFMFGHSGSKLGGIPNTEIADIFQESKAENCYLGSCDFEDEVGPYTNMVNKNVNYRPSGSWWGVNPDGSSIDDAMWSRVTKDEGVLDYEMGTAKIITPTLGVDYQTKKLKKGGGIEKYTMYKDYVNGIYTGDKKESIAQKNYDRLNRLHYREAKTNQMTPANYILSYLME